MMAMATARFWTGATITLGHQVMQRTNDPKIMPNANMMQTSLGSLARLQEEKERRKALTFSCQIAYRYSQDEEETTNSTGQGDEVRLVLVFIGQPGEDENANESECPKGNGVIWRNHQYMYI